MSAQTLAISNLKPNTTRHLASFHPNIWGDRFLSCAAESTDIEDDMEQQVERLKEEVKKMIASADEPSQILNLIDLLQRLGVSYHFEKEIEEALQQVLNMNSDSDKDDDLHSVALRFRLLREQGLNVSCDVFNKFRDRNGHFIQTLKTDLQGMLSLYEAAHFRVHGEGILDDALAFTTTYLESIVPNLSPPLAAQISRTLRQPLRKSLARVEARHFISIYQEDTSHNEVLLTFAKLDFNLLQKLHQKELKYISLWWKDLDFVNKLPFTRDRVVEGYFWILGVYFEPQYHRARKFVTKVINVVSVIDDIYDAYGTLEELVVFTDAINRWDIDCIDQLPEYMKVCYKALLNVYEEIERALSEQGRSYRLHYAKEAMKKLVQAYLVEANWMNKNYVPTMDEYMSIALVSCAYPLLTVTSFVGMGDIATKEVFDWASNDPKIVRVASIICRLMDDIVSHEFEQKRGHIASSVECYMKQNGVSEEATRDEFNKQIVDAWKDINEEHLQPNYVPMPFRTRVVNSARIMDYLYKDDDEYTHVGELMKGSVAALLIDPA
ncbi:(+)-delta-cadinene synthase isozyme A, putative [Ricinus communis]|uniref:Probable terpene synthase 2 n=1 Tax=Ricinus communis TaxID=3988 RepID=TPS2_RICCO|nr:RecName: Full=Probable terpene synthase 2; Short=RcSeTPS2 [Ricinus communis]EEF38721.1 (+)-delta-cadinene synthase isozyme A, putative [Ricinus communis]|eukprot:XP_002523635.1 probable terpene synthase 2 [Ricinus communis]